MLMSVGFAESASCLSRIMVRITGSGATNLPSKTARKPDSDASDGSSKPLSRRAGYGSNPGL